MLEPDPNSYEESSQPDPGMQSTNDGDATENGQELVSRSNTQADDTAAPVAGDSAGSEGSEGSEAIADSSAKYGINWKLLDWMLRTGVLLILAYVFATTCFSFFVTPTVRQMEVPAESVDGVGTSQELALISDFNLSDLLNGNWTLGESRWRFVSKDLKSTPAEEVFSKTPEKLRGFDPEFEDEAIIEAFIAYGARKKQVGDLTYWRASYLGANGSMYTSPSPEGEIVQVVRFAFPVGEGVVNYIESAPSEYAFSDVKPIELMPLLGGAEHVAVRRSEGGIISSAVVNYSEDFEKMIAHWRYKGWTVDQVIEETSVAPGKRFRCTNGTEAILATFMGDETEGTIILVRMPRE